ncbi:MAG: hypothetical protein LBT75_02105 [Bacilli bacterium]|jgi:hypothetical protein|nr:hypothetical protein [Bacilli bacterium]
MSRMERHKERREGHVIEGEFNGLEKNSLEQEIASGYDINPINNSNINIKRKKTYPKTFNLDSLQVEKITTSEDQKEDLFDIEEVFKALEKNFRAPDFDTQLEIMSELMNNSNINRISEIHKPRNSKQIYKDDQTKQILISENELNDLLLSKENEYQKKLSRKKAWQQRNSKTIVKQATENIITDKEVKIKKFDLLSLILIIILVILLMILLFLVFSFFHK